MRLVTGLVGAWLGAVLGVALCIGIVFACGVTVGRSDTGVWIALIFVLAGGIAGAVIGHRLGGGSGKPPIL